jgi:hypothetical protein
MLPPGVEPTSPLPPSPDPPPEEREPITGPLSAIEAILRQPRRVLYHLRQLGVGRLLAGMLGCVVCGSLVYGLVVGSFSGGVQWWAAPLKVAIGLMLSAGICLPSLYIFACLGGSPARLVEIAGLVAGLLLLMTVLLVGFAPVAWVFAQSTESLVAMGALHFAFWFIATTFALRFLQAGLRGREGRLGGGIRVWTAIFVLVMLQMTTALRPILGTAETLLPTEKRFFVVHWLQCLDQKR